MNPKHKAEELIAKFEKEGIHEQLAKECAAIVCNEFIEYADDTERPTLLEYWKQVKREL